MKEAIELLSLPFFASLILIGIHCQFGLQVLKRNVVFVDLALAQSAALGATVGFMQGHLPLTIGAYAWSLGFAWGAALILSLIRHAPKGIPPEALVGVLYVATTAASLLLIEKAPQGAEHLKQILTGSVLTVSPDELVHVVPLYCTIGFLLWLAARRGWFAQAGMAGWLADLGFYAAFGIVVTSSVAMAGVLLVFSFLIIPALVGLLWANTVGRQLTIGWGVGGLAAAAGLVASYLLDTSTGATMVSSFALFLGAALGGRMLADNGWEMRRVGKLLGNLVAIVMLVSAGWFIAKPRADQPLLDALEASWPALRQAYFSPQEMEIHADAENYVKRYAAEVVRLTALEASSLWETSSVDDEKIRKISSFQQSYNEMIKGERFVMQETRSRARERLRWPLAWVLLCACLALLSFPSKRPGWLAARLPQLMKPTDRV
ncbi:MAG: metal ABC transporter permease [Propionivibrio sp.]|uniref:metal ABC transporter permease n=1 Tax=Propionivibrio sp. TaxID=2212460 RepID=UPI001A45F661|nr:metal ABC transporter permease [Propionivibrio sp.]MBL8413521.1 metal ABC transporter permease [Propionivibrio sp.]